MTLDRTQDSLHQSDLRKEADRDREAALKKTQIADELKNRTHRERLEGDKRRAEDELKRKREELARVEQTLNDANERKENADKKSREHTGMARDSRSAATRKATETKLKSRLGVISQEIRKFSTNKVPDVSLPSHDAVGASETKLAHARSEKERLTLEYEQVTRDITILKEQLKEKELLAKKLVDEQKKSDEQVRALQSSHMTMKEEHRRKTEAHEKASAAKKEAEEKIQELEEEKQTIEIQLEALADEAKQEDVERRAHEQVVSDSVSESARMTTQVADAQRKQRGLQSEIQRQEAVLRDIESELKKIPRI